VEKPHCSSPKMYSYCRSYWTTVLILPTHAFGKAIIETSKFIAYSYNIQIMHFLVRWNYPENEEKTHKIFFDFNNSN
jgi:hypothetical protein